MCSGRWCNVAERKGGKAGKPARGRAGAAKHPPHKRVNVAAKRGGATRRAAARRIDPHRLTRPGAVALRTLYPPIEPYRKDYLRVSELHEIYYEESGNRQGKPAVFLHGGPGGGADARARRFFDPQHYRIIVFDQRGCGRSRPHASLVENTTWHLVADIERLRKHLGVERWLVFGGSWGSTLSLAYSQAHPDRVTELVLRGIFLLRYQEIRWFYQFGASALYPEFWEPYRDQIPPEERDDFLSAYHKRLTGADQRTALAAARAWSIWEGSTSFLHPNPDSIKHSGEDHFALAMARIECHYFVNRGFMRHENQLIDDVPKIRHIPATIVQGRYDVVCPPMSAWDLHRAWPEADLRMVTEAGHSAFDPGNTHELVSATDRYRSR